MSSALFILWKNQAALRGTIGFIGALSSNFCDQCNRLRLTAQGRLHPCLASETGIDLKKPLVSGASDKQIAGLIRQAVFLKPKRHLMNNRPDQKAAKETSMCALGG
ncbi:MAG: hypothetical protein HY747_03735 [Elusimicrobia bacterium]|nr:hypothetical protein [Elusimicrobiota bacterium]